VLPHQRPPERGIRQDTPLATFFVHTAFGESDVHACGYTVCLMS